jgi:hypothetical protein
VPFPFDPTPVTLWTLAGSDKLASCEVRFVPIGVEARILRDGRLLYSRTFRTGDQSLAWAEERQEHLTQGWIRATPSAQ